MRPSEDPFEEYRTLGDEVKPEPRVRYEKPDTTEYMMRQVRPDEVKNPNIKDTYEYYNQGGYQYGKRPKGWRR